MIATLEALALGPPPLAIATGGVFLLAYLTCVAVQPLVRRLALRLGFLDHPDLKRRTHTRAVPRLGGVGVFAALIVAASVGAVLDSSGHIVTLLPFVIAMAVGAALLFAVGLADDIVGVPPLGKLVVQSAAALVVYAFGFRIEQLVLPPDQVFVLGWLSLPLTVVWIVGLSNAFNLIDGADGLAGGVAIIALFATAISAIVLNDRTIVWCSFALIGAMLGFLRYNWPPARIFLGDSGSLVVGFLLAVLTVKGMTRPSDGSVYAIAPIFALSYPLLDTGISILRRWLRGESLSRADGRHIHHQLQALGLGPRQTLMIVWGLSALIAGLGLSATFAPPQFTIAIAVAGAAMLVLILVYGARWLQYHELLEAGASVTVALMTARSRVRDKICARDVSMLIDRARSMREVTSILEDSAALFRFAHMQLRSGVQRVAPPPGKVSHAQAARYWALDYPVTSSFGRSDPVFLSVWCSVDSVRAAGVERVAEIIAPAIERWLLRHADEVDGQGIVLDDGFRIAGRSSAQADAKRQQATSGAVRRVRSSADVHQVSDVSSD